MFVLTVKIHQHVWKRWACTYLTLIWHHHHLLSYKDPVSNHSIPEQTPVLSKFTCFSFCWTLSADFVSLVGPDVYRVEDTRFQTDQPVWGAVTAHRDLWAGAPSRSVAQHIALNFCLDSIPWDCCCVLCYLSGDKVCWGINVCRGDERRHKTVQEATGEKDADFHSSGCKRLKCGTYHESYQSNHCKNNSANITSWLRVGKGHSTVKGEKMWTLSPMPPASTSTLPLLVCIENNNLHDYRNLGEKKCMTTWLMLSWHMGGLIKKMDPLGHGRFLLVVSVVSIV